MNARVSSTLKSIPSMGLSGATRVSGWMLGSLLLALLALMPVGAVVFFAIDSSGDIWGHLVRTSLFGYVSNTFWLLLGVGVSVFLTGVSTAWLVTMCRFPGRRVFEWLLLFPLAIPAYVIAYAYTDFLEYAGPVQGLDRKSVV